jgi:hypothetical protein
MKRHGWTDHILTVQMDGGMITKIGKIDLPKGASRYETLQLILADHNFGNPPILFFSLEKDLI